MKMTYLSGVSALVMTVQGAAATLDQQYVPQNPAIITFVGNAYAVDVSQTFTVGITGTLAGFDVRVQKPPTTALPLLFDVRTTTAGQPTEPDFGPNILASGAISGSEIPTNPGTRDPVPDTLTHVDLTQFSVPVTAGDVLAITLRSADQYFWSGDDPDEYLRGDSYVRIFGNWEDSYYDMVFRTYVQPVPEPSTAILVFIAFCRHRPQRRPDWRR